jgi:hypothetical protein
LEGQVRTWTKETLWKMCKFITNDQTMHKVMHKGSKHFKVLASEREHLDVFLHTYYEGWIKPKVKCVLAGLAQNDKKQVSRDTVVNLMTCLTMFFLCHNCTENTHLLQGEEIITLKKIGPSRLHRGILFFNHLVPCVAGRKVWTQQEKANKLRSEAKKVVLVLNEAFTVLALKNYWKKRWNDTGMALWTDSRVGNYQYMAWADAAYFQFDGLCQQIREQRKKHRT